MSTHQTCRHSVCVFCASSDHIPDAYLAIARELGAALVGEDLELIYGGGNNGLMGVLSETVHRQGGRHVGVITTALRDMGFASGLVDEMIVIDGMRARKAIMEDRADAFIGLPGGFGTIEELAEIITLRQLGLHDKPIVLVDSGGYWQPFIDLIARISEAGFAHGDHERLFATAATPEALFALLDTTPEPQIAPDPTRF